MRYFPQNSEDIRQMLETIGVSSVEELFHRAIPDSNRCCEPLKLAPALSEPEIARYFQERERENLCSGYTLFLGGGCYNHYVPEAVNALSSKAEFVTPYTPYQPEISQGTLQAIFEYQTMVSSLTGMEYSNASLYDGATAAAEGILMAWRMTKKTRFLVARSVHPEYLATIRTYVRNFGLVVELIDTDEFGMVCPLSFEKLYDESVGAVMVQSPNFFGVIEEYGWIKEKIGESKCLLISVTAEALSLGYLKSPAAWGADIAVGEAQSFGLYPSFGGPGLGFFTTSNKKFLWEMPGRVVGETVDTEGKTGYVLTLSTREQHIRRERATSNICSNQAWCLTRASIFLSLMGPEGLREAALQNHSKAVYAQKELEKRGIPSRYKGPIFNEFVVLLKDARRVQERLLEKKIVAGIPLCWFFPEETQSLLITVTETNTKEEIDRLVKELEAANG